MKINLSKKRLTTMRGIILLSSLLLILMVGISNLCTPGRGIAGAFQMSDMPLILMLFGTAEMAVGFSDLAFYAYGYKSVEDEQVRKYIWAGIARIAFGFVLAIGISLYILFIYDRVVGTNLVEGLIIIAVNLHMLYIIATIVSSIGDLVKYYKERKRREQACLEWISIQEFVKMNTSEVST